MCCAPTAEVMPGKGDCQWSHGQGCGLTAIVDGVVQWVGGVALLVWGGIARTVGLESPLRRVPLNLCKATKSGACSYCTRDFNLTILQNARLQDMWSHSVKRGS